MEFWPTPTQQQEGNGQVLKLLKQARADRTASVDTFSQARCRDVRPTTSFALMSTLASNNALITFALSLSAAWCREVRPWESAALAGTCTVVQEGFDHVDVAVRNSHVEGEQLVPAEEGEADVRSFLHHALRHQCTSTGHRMLEPNRKPGFEGCIRQYPAYDVSTSLFLFLSLVVGLLIFLQ